MSEITKCPGDGCPIREECYRYTAPAGEWQARFVETPGYYTTARNTGLPLPEYTAQWDCDYYLPVKWEPEARNKDE
jgi:hypothetical protein